MRLARIRNPMGPKGLGIRASAFRLTERIMNMAAIEAPVWGNCEECGRRTDVRMIAKCEPCLKLKADWFWAIWEAEEARKSSPDSDTLPA